MKFKKSTLLCGLLVIMLLATTPLYAKPAGGENTLSIGALFSVTGFFSVREVPDFNQIQICADIINEQGGVNIKGKKYKIKLVLEDCKTTMDGTTSAANRLFYDKGIKLALGPTAFFAAAVGSVFDPNKVLRCITWCVHTPGELDKNTPYAFLASNGSAIHSTAAVKFIKKEYPNVKKVAFVTVDDGAVPYVTPIAKKLLESEGISIVGDPIVYPNQMQDFSPIVAKINARKSADAVFQQNGLGPHIGAIIKGLRQTGNTIPYAGSLPTLINEIIAIAGKEATKDVFTTAYTPGHPKLPAIANEIIKRTYDKYGEDYPLLLTGANSLWVLKQVIEQAQSLDSTVVKEKWESLDRVDTIFGPACVCGEKTWGIKNHVVASPQGIQLLRSDGTLYNDLVDVGCIP
jgi:branched-chain amino acid transport system substrate-binding protein